MNTCLFSLLSVILLSLTQNLIQLILVTVAMGSQPMSSIRATIDNICINGELREPNMPMSAILKNYYIAH